MEILKNRISLKDVFVCVCEIPAMKREGGGGQHPKANVKMCVIFFSFKKRKKREHQKVISKYDFSPLSVSKGNNDGQGRTSSGKR